MGQIFGARGGCSHWPGGLRGRWSISSTGLSCPPCAGQCSSDKYLANIYYIIRYKIFISDICKIFIVRHVSVNLVVINICQPGDCIPQIFISHSLQKYLKNRRTHESCLLTKLVLGEFCVMACLNFKPTCK